MNYKTKCGGGTVEKLEHFHLSFGLTRLKKKKKL